MKPVEEMILAMAEVAKDDFAWNNYVQKFQAYRLEQFVLMTQAPPERLQMFQGRAQMLSDLLTFMQECRSRAREIVERTKKAEQPHGG